MAMRPPPSSSSSRRARTGETNVGDRFQIREEIGKGSFATVFKGINRENQSLVAIKSVNLGKLNKKLKDNLYSEIKILQTLSHPHIVALLDCKESTSSIHLVMEYCELGDLSLFIKKRDRLGTHPATADMARKYPSTTTSGLNEVIVRHFLKQLASALQFLRAGNFIHRDIKPQNLLLNPSMQFLRLPGAPLIMSANAKSLIPDAGIESLPMLKIADFGFARSLPQTSLAETLCGSPLYMAPEILRYEKYDAKADLWSVGTVLFEMVTGKPPFRANNHVELLRKIEQGEDVIRFSKDAIVSPGMKQIIRDLLKRNPVERISFESFFNHQTVVETIPGLVEDDLPQPPKPAEPIPVAKTVARKTSSREVERASRSHRSSSDIGSYEAARDVASRGQSGLSRGEGQPAPRGTPPRARIDTHEMPRADRDSQQPTIKPAATTPNPRELRDQGAVPRNVAMVRQASRESQSPGSSLLTDKPAPRDRPQQKDDRARREEREKAALDVAFERDYVLVEKRAIEVNALADEMTTGGKKPGKHSSSGGGLARRATTQGAPNSGPGAVPARAVTINQGRPALDTGIRHGSYERRYGPNGPSPSSATSVISKAVQAASLRLFGFYSPPSLGIGRKESPPQMYSPFPAYPTSPSTLGLLVDGKPSSSLDEDLRAAAIIEEKASISDVVYGFAEIKYRQLFPNTPSMDYGLSNQPEADTEEDGLTVEAIVELSEEALVLYVNNLGLLAKAMDIAGAWWVNKTRNESSPTNAQTSNRINSVVQWLRTRFNEVLEKAEVVRLKLVATQKSLPSNHPFYPGNHDEVKGAQSAEGVVLSTGITAEKVLYERALEMSRTAAVDEIANCNLKGCEISYISAIRMLEAVLETDRGDGEEEWMGDDREAIVRVVTMVKARLNALRKKVSFIDKHRPASAAAKGQSAPDPHSGGSTPTIPRGSSPLRSGA